MTFRMPETPCGSVKLHNEDLDSAALSDDWLCRLWVTCLLKTNPELQWFRGSEVSAGHFVFTHRLLADFLNVSRGKLSRGLNALEAAGEIVVTPGPQFTTVSIPSRDDSDRRPQ